MRVAKIVGMTLLVVTVLGLAAQVGNLRSDVERLQGEMRDLTGVAEGFDRVSSEVESLTTTVEDLTLEVGVGKLRASAVDDLRGDAETAIERVEEEFAFMCAQFTAVECLSFPNGAGR